MFSVDLFVSKRFAQATPIIRTVCDVTACGDHSKTVVIANFSGTELVSYFMLQNQQTFEMHVHPERSGSQFLAQYSSKCKGVLPRMRHVRN